MRIAVVVHNGVKHDARVLKGAASLKAQGHDVRVFGLTPDECQEFLLPNGVPVYLTHRDVSSAKARIEREGLPRGRASSIWTSFRIQGESVFESVKNTFHPDIIHMHDHLTLTAAAYYKKEFSCPLVWDAHEIYEDLASIESVRAEVNAKIIRENARYVDGFITLNQSIADFYHSRYPNLPDAILIPNAVERMAQTVYDGRLHEAAKLRPQQKVLLFQGGYSPNRGITALLEASASLTEDWSLVFMGWGKLADEIKSYADAKSDRPSGQPQVAMIPSAPHDELLSWTAGATLGTIPYENTGLNHLYCSPNKLWEYPAAGVPILATDLPEMKKQIDKYGIGITVRNELSPKQIANSVNDLTDEAISRLKENCGQYSIAEAWQNYEPKLTGLHAQLGKASGAIPTPWYEKITSEARKIFSRK
ncbi:putative glycosyl transferase [Brevibacterium casei]|uniref:Putative glycosyl transferase n=1 Tax=Brevibacterium casei TaxID=33889 RepID=A0A449DB03_9MICO|nr:glycosyltransferase [Brevibacterium casei]VEW14730.1 putative glycosyl transferase [Brevibacterium casei]